MSERKPDEEPEDEAGGEGLADWYKEDARRYNELGEACRDIAIPVGADEPPPLNPDGTLKEAGESESGGREPPSPRPPLPKNTFRKRKRSG
jgi:hypothetical protein